MLMINGSIFVVYFERSARLLMEGWKYCWWRGRTILLPSVVMTTGSALGTERSRSGLTCQSVCIPGPTCYIWERSPCRLLCWVGVDGNSKVISRMLMEE